MMDIKQSVCPVCEAGLSLVMQCGEAWYYKWRGTAPPPRKKILWEELHCQYHAAEVKNVRLQAIVDKLPKTADGVPVIYGDTVYWWEDEQVQTGTWRGIGRDGPTVECLDGLCWPPMEWLCSTAELAKEKL